METGIKVGDCMKTSLVTVLESMPVVEASRKMAETGVGSLLVLNSEKGVYGIVTERDLVVKALARGRTDLKVKEICTKTLVSIPISVDISVAAKLMGAKNIKRIVVTSQGRIVGIVSQKDLISIAPSLYGAISPEKQLTLKTY